MMKINRLSFLSYVERLVLSLRTCIATCGFISVRQRSRDCDPRLQLAVFDRVGCCLPARWREWLRFGIDYSTISVDPLGRYDMTGLEEIGQQKEVNYVQFQLKA